jgi:hypothetical protein
MRTTPTMIGASALAIVAMALASQTAAAATGTVGDDSVLVAQDTSPAPATIPARIVGIDANIVAGLTITGHPGGRISASAKGHPTRSVLARTGRPAVLKGLTPGVRYAITIAGRRIGTAIPLAQVGPAAGLRVATTDTPGTVHITWSHTPARGEGSAVSFEVTAIPLAADGTDTAPVITHTATSTTATLSDLDADARYRFTVTPRNTASSGRSTSATMTRTLAATSGPAAPPPAPAPSAPTPAPPVVPAPAPAPPAPPAPPATKTVYVCPEAYTETSSGQCQKTLPYTFTTIAYTFHTGVVGSHVVHHGPTQCDYLPNPSSPTGLDIYCIGAWDETVLDYGQVKDATPTGYTDTGTAWTKKDPTPSGYTDTGTAWVQTVPKVAKIVPA